MDDPLSVTVQPLSSYDALGRKWADLERRATPSFFLSWSWIGSWLTTFRPRAEVIEARQGERIVALGVLVRHAETRHRVLHVRQLRLHQTGAPEQDEVWIEYNGFLLDRSAAAEARQACIAHLCAADDGWDELVIGVVEAHEVPAYACGDLCPLTIWQAPSYGIDLTKLRAGGGSYLDSLSRNTRQQIRRAIRLYDQRGGLAVRRAQTTEEALRMLAEAGELHRRRWQGSAPGRGFANPQFVAFHESLVKEAFPKGEIEILRCDSGGAPFAYQYNFVKAGRVYFYLAGLSYEDDPKIKPGLVSHALCVQQHLDEGACYYDFMGGAARYKESLAQPAADLVVVAYQRPRIKLRLEAHGRALQRWWRGRTGGDGPGVSAAAAAPISSEG